MVSKKDKRHSGRITPRIFDPKMKYTNIHIEALGPMDFFDEWEYWKDGMRDTLYLEWKKIDKAKSHKVTKAKGLYSMLYSILYRRWKHIQNKIDYRKN